MCDIDRSFILMDGVDAMEVDEAPPAYAEEEATMTVVMDDADDGGDADDDDHATALRDYLHDILDADDGGLVPAFSKNYEKYLEYMVSDIAQDPSIDCVVSLHPLLVQFRNKWRPDERQPGERPSVDFLYDLLRTAALREAVRDLPAAMKQIKTDEHQIQSRLLEQVATPEYKRLVLGLATPTKYMYTLPEALVDVLVEELSSFSVVSTLLRPRRLHFTPPNNALVAVLLNMINWIVLDDVEPRPVIELPSEEAAHVNPFKAYCVAAGQEGQLAFADVVEGTRPLPYGDDAGAMERYFREHYQAVRARHQTYCKRIIHWMVCHTMYQTACSMVVARRPVASTRSTPIADSVFEFDVFTQTGYRTVHDRAVALLRTGKVRGMDALALEAAVALWTCYMSKDQDNMYPRLALEELVWWVTRVMYYVPPGADEEARQRRTLQRGVEERTATNLDVIRRASRAGTAMTLMLGHWSLQPLA